MNRGLLFTTLLSTAALVLAQACSSEESTDASDGGTSSTSSSSGNTTATSSSSGETSSSGSTDEDTCVPGGGACVCGGTSSPCPNGGARDSTLKCKQGPQGSGECTRTCCKGGDSGLPPNPDAAPIAEAGPDATDAAGQ
jgi:hypothetical protein